MQSIIRQTEAALFAGAVLDRETAGKLARIEGSDIYTLMDVARRVRDHFGAGKVDLCSIVNAKSGACSEDCRFCAQSAHHQACVKTYDLLDPDAIVGRARVMEAEGAHRFSLVTSGRGMSDAELEPVLAIYERLRRETKLSLCASLGILNEAQLRRLAEAGVTMYHHNLEASRRFFPQICTTHSYDERIATIRAAQAAGMVVCSGGIFSMGETIDDRIDMAFELRELGIRSVPINILNPIAGTPLEGQPLIPPLEILKSIALYRLILPSARIRMAGGREGALRDLQSLPFIAGADAALVGSYLTTSGRTVAEDIQMLRDLGLNVNNL
ncbi:biotin synthase [Heliomicrobium modesticaldum Ice1]|uniref:Biotin synthase n=1 Tax=Heliobacterium modesticaldum (strain ATCC 51547 / Ice1) TaxID=498761 RepID=BIOB_HELMI|nr:biotin synthase BioB [Heliomicrobium modesticaldum]B0TE53.1 RecName: Full=Biotin synthase [Heliomicrobium modesticaldum Ice1]ABZ84248.1 biotin synthase [Heliomicrobium modesticaldum Ice1]